MHAWLSRVASSATGAGKRRGGEGNNTSSGGDSSSPGGSRGGGFGSVANYLGGGPPLSAEDVARGQQITEVCEKLVREIQRILRSAKEAHHHHQQQNASSRQIVMKMVEDVFDLCLIGGSREEEAEDERDDEDGREAHHGDQQQQQQQQEEEAIVAVNKALHENVEMVCGTLEKLMQFDHQFVEVLGTTGVLELSPGEVAAAGGIKSDEGHFDVRLGGK
eukprot:evm.model.NODE_32286_length_32794_cov_31.879429.4